MVLANDLVCSAPEATGNTYAGLGTGGSLNGLIVGHDNITIDLNGHTITGAPTNGFYPAVTGTTGSPVVNPPQANGTQSGAGVVSVGFSHVTIKNGTFKGWNTAVRVRSIEGVTPSIGNLISGITVNGCAVDTRTPVAPATTLSPAATATRGIDLAEPGSVDNVIQNSTVNGLCTQGMRVHEAQGTVVDNNTMTGVGAGNSTTTASGGIVFDCGGSALVTNNVVEHTTTAASAVGGYGILVGQQDHSTFKMNTLRGNQADGMRLSIGGATSECEGDGQTSSGNTITNNKIENNAGNGIQLGSHATSATPAMPASGNSVTDNKVLGNLNGIDIAVGSNDIEGNTLKYNHFAGVLAEKPSAGDPFNNTPYQGCGPCPTAAVPSTIAFDFASARGAAGSTVANNTAENNGTGFTVTAFAVQVARNVATDNGGKGFDVTGAPPVNATSPAPTAPATSNPNTTPGYCDDAATCSNRLGGNQANGNHSGGLVVSAAATEYNVDLGGNTGSGNVGGPDCAFGSVVCAPAPAQPTY
jgi:hypothetical protein